MFITNRYIVNLHITNLCIVKFYIINLYITICALLSMYLSFNRRWYAKVFSLRNGKPKTGLNLYTTIREDIIQVIKCRNLDTFIFESYIRKK